MNVGTYYMLVEENTRMKEVIEKVIGDLGRDKYSLSECISSRDVVEYIEETIAELQQVL